MVVDIDMDADPAGRQPTLLPGLRHRPGAGKAGSCSQTGSSMSTRTGSFVKEKKKKQSPEGEVLWSRASFKSQVLRGFLGWWLVPMSLPPHFPLLSPAPLLFLPPFPSTSGRLPTLPRPAVPGVCWSPYARPARPTAMELPQPEPVAGPALSPAGMRGGAQRPDHLPGLRLGAHGLLGSPERAAASSPVTTLTQTMHHLAGLGRFEQAIQAASRVIQNEQFAIRHFQSLPGRLLGDSPVLRNITNSQASGTWRKTEACDQAAHGSGEDKENDGFVFKMPGKPTHPSHSRALGEWASRREVFAQRPSSAPDLMCLTPERKMEVEELIPLARCHFSLTPSTGAVEEDNGFVDILETDLKENDVVPPGMESLISAPLVKTSEKEEKQDLIMYSKCQRLFHSPSTPCGVIRPILKRLERPQDQDLPAHNKRKRSVTPPEEELREAEEPVSTPLVGWDWAGLPPSKSTL